MRLIAFLGLFLLGCATSGDSASPEAYPTLEVYNTSGSSVRIFVSSEGREYPLGSAWPGKSCFRLGFMSRQSAVRFGIRHIAGFDTVWSPAGVFLADDGGLFLGITQPSQAVFDLINLQLSEKC